MTSPKERLTDLGMTAASANTPDAFGQLIHQELDYWGKVVRKAGLRPS